MQRIETLESIENYLDQFKQRMMSETSLPEEALTATIHKIPRNARQITWSSVLKGREQAEIENVPYVYLSPE